MFICKNLKKSYGNNIVLNNFSYVFPQTGLILLYGESGCGKTTLLNILAGVVEFDEGTISYNGNSYRNKIYGDPFSNSIAYITQDPHFIYYLTVFDNLKLCSTDDNKIIELMTQFGLSDRKDHYPNTLSGGEKQRLALLQALLMDKKIIIMDEPTSALDKDNKMLVFKMLQLLKSKKLIMFSSHDSVAKDFADEIIDFKDCDTDIQMRKEIRNSLQTIENRPKRELAPFFNKWYSYERQKKKSKFMLLIIISLSILAICICDTPDNKYNSNIEKSYRINQFRITSSNVNDKLINQIRNENDVVEVNLSYNLSVPIEVDKEHSLILSDYDISAATLPFSSKAFPFSNKIKYGTYYTSENQIILSAEKAQSIGDPESLVGKTMHVNLYNDNFDFEIVGVFDTFTEYEKQYLRASGITINDDETYFLNGNFTQRYWNDNNFYMYGNRSYIIYCNSFSAMNNIFKKYSGINDNTQFIYADIDGEIKNLFNWLFYIIVPFVFITILTTALFYYQTQKIEFGYNKHVFGVYDYLGYPLRSICWCLIRGNVLELLIVAVKGLAISFPVMLLANYINSKLFFVPFELFSYNIALIAALIVFIVLLGIIMAFVNMKKISTDGWYQTLIEQRDLL